MISQNTEQIKEMSQIRQTQTTNPTEDFKTSEEVKISEDTPTIGDSQKDIEVTESDGDNVTTSEETSEGSGLAGFVMIVIGFLLYLAVLLVAVGFYVAMFLPKELSVYFY